MLFEESVFWFRYFFRIFPLAFVLNENVTTLVEIMKLWKRLINLISPKYDEALRVKLCISLAPKNDHLKRNS